ncbi:iron chelate uptake ABC transporter family permease subunit [Gleimia hominis]|uniref:iron chelate uptake ABC transporter family permease subunit n=1 Tax=Gleimia hominis TaxID=595468 RepID=UPI001E5BD2C0|nr:iron chelate uptake ABC transporter family permease subunit [Gleimia hominis]WIK64525.1 iron chelate uptake ABC transporter family permease subunit [Gleimia hominis]
MSVRSSLQTRERVRGNTGSRERWRVKSPANSARVDLQVGSVGGEPVAARSEQRQVGAFARPFQRRRYFALLALIGGLGVLFAAGLLLYNNPVPVTKPGFWIVARLRADGLVAIAFAAVCHALATVAFQTVTANRIITPSIIGFEALYTLIHTATVYFLGLGALVAFTGVGPFLLQVAAMVVLAVVLYSWLLSGRRGNMQVMLLVGIVLGSGLAAMASFMRRMLLPSEFDVLQARLFGSINNADRSYYPYALVLVLAAGVALYAYSRQLNVIALGREACTSLGVNHRRGSVYVLTLVAVLMAVSTALVGPLTFFGFLTATLAYQAADTYDHRYLFPMAIAIGFAILTGAYFLMNHVFYAQGVVSIIIEMVGGLTFLVVIVKKGYL